MNPIDKSTINEKLEKLEEQIEFLEKLKSLSLEEFKAEPKNYNSAMFAFIIAIEAIVDIANHILSEGFAKSAKSYSEAISLLGEVNIVPKDFAKENLEMAKFRNRLIYIYEDVNLDEVYQNLQKAPDIFRRFVEYYSEFLEK